MDIMMDILILIYFCKLKMIIIIIGLPACGKTSYYNINLKNEYKLYDDFINNFYDNELIIDIMNNEDLCIIDPRLCNYNIFIKFYSIFLEYTSANNIKLLLFNSDKNKCFINAINRNTINVTRTIEFYSNIYNIDNYLTYNHEIINMY